MIIQTLSARDSPEIITSRIRLFSEEILDSTIRLRVPSLPAKLASLVLRLLIVPNSPWPNILRDKRLELSGLPRTMIKELAPIPIFLILLCSCIWIAVLLEEEILELIHSRNLPSFSSTGSKTTLVVSKTVLSSVTILTRPSASRISLSPKTSLMELFAHLCGSGFSILELLLILHAGKHV